MLKLAMEGSIMLSKKFQQETLKAMLEQERAMIKSFMI